MDIGKTVVRFALRSIGATGYFIISAIDHPQSILNVVGDEVADKEK